MRVARRVPASKIDATSVSPKSQAAVLRAIRGVVFTGTGEVYFIEAVGAERVKIGVSGDVAKRFGQLAALFPGPLRLLGKAPGGRARESSWHLRLANFHIGGEWFHLTPGVRAVIEAVIADDPE